MTISASRLASVFVNVADTLIDEFDVIDFLQMLADRTAGLITASAVGLLLADQHRQLQFIAASDESSRLLELFQLQSQNGPCLDAFNVGVTVTDADLCTAQVRWPHFAPRAVADGFRWVHAFPLRLRNEVIGAMNVFGTVAGASLGDTDAQIVQALADVAAIGLLQERAIRHSSLLTEQLQGALNSRIIVEQAKGAIAQAHGVAVDDAFSLIRAFARRNNLPLSEVSRRIVTDLDSLPELTRPAERWSPRSTRRGTRT